jgi:hypothetical protein
MGPQQPEKKNIMDYINAGLGVYNTIKDAQVVLMAKELNRAGTSEDRMEKLSADLWKKGYKANYIDPKTVSSPVIGQNAGWVVTKA